MDPSDLGQVSLKFCSLTPHVTESNQMGCAVIFSMTCLLGYSEFFSFTNGKRKNTLEQSDSVSCFWAEPCAELLREREFTSPRGEIHEPDALSWPEENEEREESLCPLQPREKLESLEIGPWNLHSNKFLT